MGLQRGDQMMSPGSEPRPGDWLQLPGPEAAMRRSRLPAKSARFASPASPPLASRSSQRLPGASVQVGRAGPALLGLSSAFTLSHRPRGNRVSKRSESPVFPSVLFCPRAHSCRKP